MEMLLPKRVEYDFVLWRCGPLLVNLPSEESMWEGSREVTTQWKNLMNTTASR